ncbi:MAG: hypothetical protein M3N53_13955 [Actinomycetota bacterium]|nr:hypothetical protein [Actinomycetota bacterium]
MARRTGILVVFAALLALVLALGAPAALAHHSADHTQGGGSENAGNSGGSETGGGNSGNSGNSGSTGSQSDHDGDADSDENTTYTEDNDNDGKKNNEDTTPSSHPSGKDRTVESGGSGNQGNSESDPDDDGRGPERCEPVSARNSGDGTCGADKPNGTGGTDIYDQDGNNGCGNDQDFDDDNEGLCGGPDRTKPNTITKTCPDGSQMPANGKCGEVKGGLITTPGRPCDADATMPGIQPCDTPPVVAPGLEENPAGPGLEENPAGPVEGVLGIRLDAAQPAAVAPAAVAAAPAVGAAAAAQGGVLPFTGASDLIPMVAIGLLFIAVGALSLKARPQA